MLSDSACQQHAISEYFSVCISIETQLTVRISTNPAVLQAHTCIFRAFWQAYTFGFCLFFVVFRTFCSFIVNFFIKFSSPKMKSKMIAKMIIRQNDRFSKTLTKKLKSTKNDRSFQWIHTVLFPILSQSFPTGLDKIQFGKD